MARQDQDKYIVRLPEGMRSEIKAAAAANNRSMNSEIVARLEASFLTHSLYADIAKVIDEQIDREVNARLRQIAAQIGGA